jgi:hypothetical protein
MPAFVWRNWWKPWKDLNQDSQFPGRDINLERPKCPYDSDVRRQQHFTLQTEAGGITEEMKL